MKQTDDWFFAGAVAGAIGGVAMVLFSVILVVFGVIKQGTFWQAMGGLFYNKELLKNWTAQAHGMFDGIGVIVANGILLSRTLLVTGRDHLYVKSIILSAAGAYFLFIFIYPHTSLGKNSLVVPWVAIFGHVTLSGILPGYILKKICSFKR
jgi:hypothetical protein